MTMKTKVIAEFIQQYSRAQIEAELY